NDAQNHDFTATAYNGSAWATGGGVLYIENSAIPSNTDGFAKTTLLTGYTAVLPYQTYYFRTHFNFSGPLAGVSLSAKLMCDDGAVLYLNGQELPRVRMAAGAVTYGTLASAAAP